MKISDRITGPALSLFGAVVIVGAMQLPTVPGVRFGADLMPTLIGIGFICLGLAIALGGFLTEKGRTFLDVSEWRVPLRNYAAAIWTLGGLVIGIFLFQSVGFPLIGIIYMAGLMLLMRARILTTVIVSPVVVLILYYGFSKGLMVPLPAGILGGILP
ncbi:tripartite tricarboxylate transporter TctB family protein [Martelella sp. HB161492]|uniref:tripartite tricarboxylate transporter TctB family protein n=1 Tax=Martelella sp. HB161492 TaxID=2720726 RepID=UPI0015926BFD|nr:tripartite tricarboxylate transporter TctB family protein [Martelella sp. HB161492]